MASIVLKPWGSYQVIEEGEKNRIKRIIVKQGGKLSLQAHQHRSEHWVVVKGEAEVTIEKKISVLHLSEHIFIPFKAKHRLKIILQKILLSLRFGMETILMKKILFVMMIFIKDNKYDY